MIGRVGSGLLVVVRNADTIQIDHVQLTSDSVKGAKPIPASVRDSLIDLQTIERLQVMQIPSVANRPRPSARGFVVLRGEPVRVTYLSPYGKGALVISTTVGAVTHHGRWDAVPLRWLSADSTLRKP